jgi:hypothetical protein
MPSVNVLRNVNLALDRKRSGAPCPNTAGNPLQCGAPTLSFTPLSLDEVNQKWYPTNSDGFYTPNTGSAGTITGSANLISITQNGCPYPAVYFSGSLTVPLSTIGVQIGIVTGSFSLSGTAGSGFPWFVISTYEQTGSVNLKVGGTGAPLYTYPNYTSKNSLVGFKLGNFTTPFGEREVTLQTSGSAIATNPPLTNIGFPLTLGSELTLTGEGIIRSFGYGEGTTSQQTQFNCLFGTTPSA